MGGWLNLLVVPYPISDTRRSGCRLALAGKGDLRRIETRMSELLASGGEQSVLVWWGKQQVGGGCSRGHDSPPPHSQFTFLFFR